MRGRIGIGKKAEDVQRFVRYEGGHIGITGDLKAATDWYCRHMGLTFAWDSPADQMALMMTPGNTAGVAVKGTPGGVREPNVRLCFSCPDLSATHAALTAGGVRLTPIKGGPGGVDYFDFYDLEGTRLTATVESSRSLAEQFPDARFLRYAPARIGVSDLGAAIAWYGRHIGLTLLEEHRAEGCALLDLGHDCPVWLETLPAGAFVGRQDATVRPYLMTTDIREAHRYCTEQGFGPSEIDGAPNALQLFWFYDPDGNRVNVWTYPQAREQYEQHQRTRAANQKTGV